MASSSLPGRAFSRITLALFAASGFVMLSGLVFLAPFDLGPYAQQNDVYMGNLFIGLPIFVLGSLLFAASLAGLGLSKGMAGLLALVGILPAVAFLLGVSLLGIAICSYTAGAYAAVLLAVSWFAAHRHTRIAIWRRGLLLALLGIGALVVFYMLFGGHYSSIGDTPINWPPYLTIPILGITICLAVAIFLIGWIWSAMGLQ
jgi:hypothetical protein